MNPPKKGDQSFERQTVLEVEGGAAALKGEPRSSCPYPDGSFEWNHWVYGHDIALAEKETIAHGFVYLYSTGSVDHWSKRQNKVPVADAIASGQWKPRFVTDVLSKPSTTTIPSSSGEGEV